MDSVVAVATLSPVTELRFADRHADASIERTVAALEREHGQQMFGFVRAQGLADSEAQDAVQETLLRLLRELRAGREIDEPRAWAFRALYRLAMDAHRGRRRLTLIAGRLDADLAERQTTQSGPVGDRIAVWSEVDRLPVRQRQVLYLRYRADLPFEEIGKVIGITAGAARTHAAQAMATLRARLSREDFA